MYCLFCVILCIVCVYICTELQPPGSYQISVKYIISFQDDQHMKVVMLSALCTSRLYPPRDTRSTHFC